MSSVSLFFGFPLLFLAEGRGLSKSEKAEVARGFTNPFSSQPLSLPFFPCHCESESCVGVFGGDDCGFSDHLSLSASHVTRRRTLKIIEGGKKTIVVVLPNVKVLALLFIRSLLHSPPPFCFSKSKKFVYGGLLRNEVFD